MNPLLYWTLLTLTCGYAISCGRRDERVVAMVCILASVATALVLSPLRQRYSGVESGELLVDLAALSAFVLIALRSDRFWPLWVAGLQLTTSVSHFLKAIEFDLLPQAYAAAAKIWSYPILFILAAATWRAHRRRLAERPPAPAA